jgi:FemAB-related protein (PEP-CTERM system-associated)
MSDAIVPFAGSEAEWDAFVAAHPAGTTFHRYAWRRVIEETFGHEVRLWCARDDTGRLCGVLPLVRVKSRLFGHYLVSMPFVSYGGPLGSPEATAALARFAAELATETGADLLELRCRSEVTVPLAVSHRKVTVCLDLPADGSEALWSQLKAKVRSQIRRPQKEGLAVRFGPEESGNFYRVFARHMRDLGTPVMPRSWFEGLRQALPNQVEIGCVYQGREPIAAGWGFRSGGEFEITWAAALQRYNAMAPNMLLYWAFLERSANAGARVFNFGRCTPGGGTHRFKLQWGGHDQPLWWYQQGRHEKGSTPSAADSQYAWGQRIWQRLPLAVANVVGPRIVRYIP